MSSRSYHSLRVRTCSMQHGRPLAAVQQRHQGICCGAGELPSGFDKLAFVWERGTKVFATEAEPVNPHTRAVFWKQYLKQVGTRPSSSSAAKTPGQRAMGCCQQCSST